MTTVLCGRTNLSERAEAITRVLRAEQGYRLDDGCGQAFDLDNEFAHLRVYRCLECARWLCRPCIVRHFEETTDAYQPPDSPRQGERRQSTDEEVRHVTARGKPEQGRRAVGDRDVPAGSVTPALGAHGPAIGTHEETASRANG